ncbi:hypothetical protein IOLA_106 [uncultured bacterium]|nr:hypothetical protein IOLA_106 [uncultured bacterium]
MKLSQEKRIEIINNLLPMKASIPNKINVGDTIKFKYVYNKIKINGKGMIIKVKNHGISKGVKVFCKKENMIINLYFADSSLQIDLILPAKNKIKKSHLNHLINNT